MLEINKIYCGDCLELMKQIEDKSVDLVITDPPYNIGKKGVDSGEELLKRDISEIYRVLKDNSYFVTFCSIAKLGEVINYVQNVGFIYKWQLITYYSNINNVLYAPLGRSVYASILVFSKGNPKRKGYILDVFKIVLKSKEPKIGHPTPKPIEVLEKIIHSCSKEGDIILDCYIGSGSVALACIKENREFIGFEINPEYVKIANKRLKQETLLSV